MENDAIISFYDHITDKVESHSGNIATFFTSHPMNVSVCVSGHNRIPFISYGSKTGDIYIQNETVTGNREYNGNIVKIGSNVTDSIPTGEVRFEGGRIKIDCKSVLIQPGTTIHKGTIFTVNPHK